MVWSVLDGLFAGLLGLAVAFLILSFFLSTIPTPNYPYPKPNPRHSHCKRKMNDKSGANGKEKTTDSESQQKPRANVDIENVDPDGYYATLGLSTGASTEEIKTSFRKMSMLHHPDKNLDNQEEATKRFVDINVAHEVRFIPFVSSILTSPRHTRP